MNDCIFDVDISMFIVPKKWVTLHNLEDENGSYK